MGLPHSKYNSCNEKLGCGHTGGDLGWILCGPIPKQIAIHSRQGEAKEALDLLVQHTVSKAVARELDARGLANTAHGAAHGGRGELLGVLFAALARATEWVSNLSAQNTANTAWAFATVNHSHEKLFTELALAAERRVSEFNA